MTPFDEIRERAARRKGGAAALASLLPAPADAATLAAIPDDRILSEMTKRVFSAGFVWRVIEAKWPGFEAAFLGFQPAALLFQPDEFWHDLARDPRIVRNPQKIRSVRDNAAFVSATAKEHGSFSAFLAAWPKGDQLGLQTSLAKRGSRLGGATGAYFLRFIGYDGFIVSRDVVLCLKDAGLDVPLEPTAKGDLKKIQAQLVSWAEAADIPLSHVSRICAMSVGENNSVETIRRYIGMDEGSGEA